MRRSKFDDQTPRLPTLAELDKATPDNPVSISEGFSGPSVTGVQIYGVSDNR